MMTGVFARQPPALVFYVWVPPEAEMQVGTLPRGLVNGGFLP